MRAIEEKAVKKMERLYWDRTDYKQYYLSKRDEVWNDYYGTHYRLWNTNVFTHWFKTDKLPERYTCNGGQWWTPTTKSRINAMLSANDIPFGLYQENFVWYWAGYSHRGERMTFNNNDIIYQIPGNEWVINRGDGYGNIIPYVDDALNDGE